MKGFLMSSMRTLLVNPPPAQIVEAYDAPNYPHLGVAYLAAYLRSMRCSVSVLDAKMARMNIGDTVQMIDHAQPDLLGLTAYTPEIVHVASLAREVKKRCSRIRVVLGGTHASVLPRETLEEYPQFDAVIFGEGEITLHHLVEALNHSSPLEGIKGLAYRANGLIHLGEPRPWNTALDDLPFPAWDLFPPTEHYLISVARGCPFRCIFCTRPLGNQVRARSPKSVTDEFRDLVTRYGAKRITFTDETFGVNRRSTIEILDAIVDQGLSQGVRLDLHTRVDAVDEELLEKLKRAGCTAIGFGVESGNEEILRRSGKGITLHQVRKSVAMTKRLGIRTKSYFILGFPNETKRTAWDTINFARKLNTDSVSIGIMMPFPKTGIGEMIRRGEGGYRRLSTDWADYNKQTGAVVELERLGRRTLVLFQILGYLMCYLCNMRFRTFVGLARSRYRQVLRIGYNLVRRR
jgi:anaerobic magnesium-protoporphyrin IX monomethyl ester cyclase